MFSHVYTPLIILVVLLSGCVSVPKGPDVIRCPVSPPTLPCTQIDAHTRPDNTLLLQEAYLRAIEDGLCHQDLVALWLRSWTECGD